VGRVALLAVRFLTTSTEDFDRELAAFCREAAVPVQITESVAAILADVRERGDEAVAHYAEKFDGARLAPSAFCVAPEDLAAAHARLPFEERSAIESAHAAILAYNCEGLAQAWQAKNPHGAMVGEKFDPIRRVGLYVPGGQVPLVSTVLMTATLAKIADCPEIAVFTPSDAQGRVADGLLAALHFLGISEVYRIGGVQAIGAMAYGTETIRRVDKLFGPGNAYVCEAKRQVFGAVGVDSLPGPSELMVVADETARADFVASDLLAQAEHGSGREKIYLVVTSEKFAREIEAEIAVQARTLSRSEKAQRVLDVGFLVVVVSRLEEAAAVANTVAPEHLELIVEASAETELLKQITTAGAIMIGNHTPTALGDFTAGPSHVLPTAGSGRFFSGLRVADFVRRTSLVRYDRESVAKAEPVVAAFAAMEQLDAHGRSVSIRVK